MTKTAALILVFLTGLVPTADALAQTQTFVIQDGKLVGGNAAPGKSGGELVLSNDQKLMFEASNKVVNRDFKGAEAIYSQVLSINPNNIEAYIQRGIVRRELGDKAGMDTDARMVVTLANQELRINAANPTLYYRRAMGLRLLGMFEEAKRDLRYGMQIGGKSHWSTDLKAIELEQKMAASQ